MQLFKSTFSKYLKTRTNNYSVVCWPSSCFLLVFLVWALVQEINWNSYPSYSKVCEGLSTWPCFLPVLKVSESNGVSPVLSRDSFCRQKAQAVSARLTGLCLGAVVGMCVCVWKALGYKPALTGHPSTEFPLWAEDVACSGGPGAVSDLVFLL